MADTLSMPRMLHTAGIIGRNLVIYGGNEHQSEHNDYANRCFSSSLMLYNIGKLCAKYKLLNGHGFFLDISNVNISFLYPQRDENTNSAKDRYST